MAKSDYLPPRDGDFLNWHDHLNTAASGLKAALGLGDADLATLAADNTALHDRIKVLADAGAAYDRAALEKQATRRAVEGRVRALARRLKEAPGYTQALGAELGVLGADDTTDLSAAKPTLTATPQSRGVVELQFNKSKSDGVNLYTQRDGDSGWVFLARDTASPYVDNRPLLAAGKPEIRKYKAVYVLGDDEVGQPSDEITATATP